RRRWSGRECVARLRRIAAIECRGRREVGGAGSAGAARRRNRARSLHNRGARAAAESRRDVHRARGVVAESRRPRWGGSGAMKWSTMNQRDRRAVIGGILVLLSFAIFLWVVRPYR